MEQQINEKFFITNDQAVIDEIYRLTGINLTIDEILDYIANNDSTIFFLDLNLAIKSDGDSDVSIVWLDTGVKMKKNEPLMISLLKHSDYFSGFYVGTPNYLANGICWKNQSAKRKIRANVQKFYELYNKKELLDEEISNTNSEERQLMEEVEYSYKNDNAISEVSKDLYKILLFPHWKSINGLDRYLKIIGTRISQLVSQSKTEYYVSTKYKSVIVNSGMMDRFGNDILLLYRYYDKYKNYFVERFIQSKKDYLDAGFSKENCLVELKPINFFDEGEENDFIPSIEEFDINHNCLLHIIQERRNRFPDSIRTKSDSYIATQVISALKRGVKMQERDKHFARASFSGRSGKISWFMPLHIDKALSEVPELVMAIRKSGEFYEMKTILPFDDEMQDRFTALSLYSKIW